METQKNDKYDQILSAAEKMLAETGFQGLSMQKLANEAGVAAGTIYRYFSDKDDLLEQLRHRVVQGIADAVQKNVSDDMPLKERFHTMLNNVWTLANTNTAQLANQVQYDALPQAACKRVWEWENERERFGEVEKLFEQGKSEKLFKPLSNKILVALSFEVIVSLARKQALNIYPLSEIELNAAIEACWDAITIH
ncbi:TetR/AcrR family transcriptional regulator [Vibrio sp.]|uniref:TetR/AcrR family transcriptional regulator n=1 Tax=Vibrio viridaestus TaxID=2487322 RepID=A0A3N9U1J1_9VIBR|nr:TetR/AcrR family transcriptional regulator [Vibrio viridaestus]MDC0612136.1 TetR/AcrR family transcriptional regulator [Vibrio sp.]RQW61776.1 TetR/AcrR family transcriptional regulator [Vibrio viridaestus]